MAVSSAGSADGEMAAMTRNARTDRRTTDRVVKGT
jgi:hypothetical protein